MGTFLVSWLILNALLVNAQEWEKPYLLDPESETVDFTLSSITMDEENINEVIIAIINYKGNSEATVMFLAPPNGNELTGLKVRQNKETLYWELVVVNRQDYESGTIRFDMQMVLSSKQHMFTLHIRNIDDNPPEITAQQQECRIEEDTIDDDKVQCFYKVEDRDGNLEEITWTIDGEQDHSTFKFDVQDSRPMPSSQKEMTLKMGLNKALDFQVASMHIIDFQVMDTMQSTSLRIVIKVVDIPNQPPVWNSIFQSQEFNEKTDQVFTVEAKDGDIEIDDEIGYSISFPEEDWSKYISIGAETGKIAVKPIDRDYEQREIFKFVVEACEMTFTPDICIQQPITFILNDVNDNVPVFTLTPTDGNVLEIEETKISTISTKITVQDIDLGENARYSLRLTGKGDETSFAVAYETAFSVAPTTGYQLTKVDLFIVDAPLLDYEDDLWREFEFQLEAIEDVPSELVHVPIVFSVKLINRNDELPIFQACNDDEETESDACVIHIEETFPGDTYLVTMVAKDRDIDGTVEHTLLGAYANRILKIDGETGEISTQIMARPFDYETLSEVIVQVQARDSLEGDPVHNIALAQLTIKLIDVNDESPIISVEKLGESVEENREDGYDIGTVIVATDEDSMAELKVYINWDASDGIKNGRRITSSEAFLKYKECVELDIDQDSLTGKHVRATLKIKETVPNNTPDFEIFDTLDLQIVAIDEAQPEGDIPNKATIKVQVYITDLNDNPPIFSESTTTTERRVNENTCPDTLIGIITATDKDVDDELTYSLIPREDTANGLVKIGPKSGELLVDGTNKCDSIDADIPIFYLYYTVSVTDGDHTVTADIDIFVVDLNDLNPVFDRVVEGDIPLEEQSEEGVEVDTFTATDGDRDEENNKVTYSISTTTRVELRDYFKIDDQTGRVYVSYVNPDQKLDRDSGIPSDPITIVIDAKDSGARSGSLTFTIKLLDINNKIPVLKTKSLTIGEDALQGTVLTPSVQATDDDEPGTDNSRIHFEVVSIKAMDSNKEGDLGLFVLDQAGADENAGTIDLVAGRDLREYFDRYEITVQMHDYGTNPQQQESEASFIVTIDRYNFEDPDFVFPSTDEIQRGIYLSKNQVVDMPILKHGGDTLDGLSADDQQGGKFLMHYSVEDETNIITLTPSGEYLSVTRNQNLPLNTLFEITITATTDGNPKRSTSVTVKMAFVDENITPYFDISETTISGFMENQEGQEYGFPPAKYDIGELNLDLKMYYVVETKDSPFTIRDSQVPKLYLEGPLDREEQKDYTVVIQTSNREGGVVDPEEGTQLTIQIEIGDENDNPPQFEEDKYYSVFHYDDKKDYVVMKLVAHDPDDGDTVTYSKTKTDSNHASNFPDFDVETIQDYAQVKLAKDATSQASGYATVTVTAQDGDPEHDVGVPLEIYVVSEEEHIVRFKFSNDIADVEAAKEYITAILMNTFKSENGIAYEPTIRRSTSSTEADGTSITETEIYFIDTENHVPLQRAEIEVLANDITTYVKLEQQFQNVGLTLLSFSTITPETDNTIEVLRAWLIGVAVVLGSLCVLLIVAFVLKTRSLTKRLNKLSVTKYGSQESGLNRKVVPNTNRHALEGSNPAFSVEKKTPEFDQESIGSGDSDLIGVEDNPDFQQKPQKNGINRY